MHTKLKFIGSLSFLIFSIVLFIYRTNPGLFEMVEPDKNIVLVALPKSGSTYLITTLQENLGYTRMSTNLFDPRKAPAGVATYANNNEAIPSKYFWGNIHDFFKTKSTITRDHYRAPNAISEKQFGSPTLEVDNIKKYTHKIVLHLRDPRQALLSYVHHLNSHQDASFALPDLTDSQYDLSTYYKLDFNAQLDWAIENILPNMIIWMNDWLDFKQKEDASPNGLKILITTYDELIQDEMSLYHKIADFYDLSLNDAHFKRIAKNEGVRFRKGDPNEWKFVFTDPQKNRMAEIIPIHLLQRFHWDQ